MTTRLLVYFFWDRDGVVDDYVIQAIRSLRAFCDETLVVVNGALSPEGESALRAVSDTLLVRENTGHDAWAYRDAFRHIGYERLAGFDEVLVTNFTLFGPIFPLDELFGRMDASPADFWGLTSYNEHRDGREILHLQSYFVAYRKRLLASPVFAAYWDNLPPITSYEDSVQLHELSQTPYFADAGFAFDSYVPLDRYRGESPVNFIITWAEHVLVEDRCPFIKRRVFFYDGGELQYGVSMDKLRHITDFIKGYTDYEVELMHDNLRRTQKARGRVSLLRRMKRLLGALIHPNPEVRRHLRTLLLGSPDRQWLEYLDLFLRKKKAPEQMMMWRPPLQHVGRNTYAMPDLFVQSTDTVIGSFCSIGPRVVLGHGKHPLDFLSTSPHLYFQELGYKSDQRPNFDRFWYIEPIHIGNDVWIGDGAFVKNGVKIGDGAIIGAHAVVTKDVPPYAIVAGVPAKVISYRFERSVIDRLLDLRWWDMPDEIVRQIPVEDVDRAIAYIEGVNRAG